MIKDINVKDGHYDVTSTLFLAKQHKHLWVIRYGNQFCHVHQIQQHLFLCIVIFCIMYFEYSIEINLLIKYKERIRKTRCKILRSIFLSN